MCQEQETLKLRLLRDMLSADFIKQPYLEPTIAEHLSTLAPAEVLIDIHLTPELEFRRLKSLYTGRSPGYEDI